MKTKFPICISLLLSIFTTAHAQDVLYTWQGDSIQCRIVPEPRKSGIKSVSTLWQDAYGYVCVAVDFGNDSIRVVQPHEFAGMRVRSSSKHLLPGRYVSLPIKKRTDFTRAMAFTKNGGSNRFFRVIYENEAAVLYDLKEREHCLEFNYSIMRKKDSVIHVIFNRNCVLKILDEPAPFPRKETKKYLKGKTMARRSKYIAMLDRYRDHLQAKQKKAD